MPEVKPARRAIGATAFLGLVLAAGSAPAQQTDPGISNSLRIQPFFEVAPSQLPSGEVKTIEIDIRNINESYGGESRSSSRQIQDGDRFEIDLGATCVAAIATLRTVSSTMPTGTFAFSSAPGAGSKVEIMYTGPGTYFDPDALLEVTVDVQTQPLACTSTTRPRPFSCAPTVKVIGNLDHYYPDVVYGTLLLGCPVDLGIVGPAGAPGPAGPIGPSGPVGPSGPSGGGGGGGLTCSSTSPCPAPSPNSTTTCTGGVCVRTCSTGFRDCNGNGSDGCEVAVATDPAHCGACGVVCSGGTPACVAGACVPFTGCTYSESFTGGGTPTTQCTNWTTFRTSCLQASVTYNTITLKGSVDPTGRTCTGAAANTLCQALRTGATTSVSCGGFTWGTGACGGGPELSAQAGICACLTPGYTVRPCIGNSNWGGINTATCGGPTQTITVVCSL